MSKIYNEVAILQRDLDRAYDRIIELEWDNDALRKQLAMYDWKATIEAWDEAWIREHQLTLPFDDIPTSTRIPDVICLPFSPEEL
jgi:hypothetical protein